MDLMITVIALIALIVVVFLAVRYLYREKKKGSKCVGCPFAEGCTKYDHSAGSGRGCCH